MGSNLPAGPTKLVVGGLIGLGLGVATFALVGWKWGLFCSALLAYEAWTFFNQYEHDTISEVVWALSQRPLVPFLLGVGTGWAILSGFIPVSLEGLWVSFSIGMLMGHFVWQAQKNGNGGK